MKQRDCRSRFLRVALLAGSVLAVMIGAFVESAELPPPVERAVDFRRDVYPILSGRCFECHQGAEALSGFRLDARGELLGESTGDPPVVVGGSAQSRLIHLVAGVKAEEVMPPDGERLTAAEVGVLRAWIDQGLAWDDELLPPVVPVSSHWAFQPVTVPAVPTVNDPSRVRNPIDAFIAARHEAAGVVAADEAPRRVLIRRLSLDLIGLPPSPEEIDAFVADESPDAYGQLVERLLASPHYGERWGRHWLDLARWAESEGYESNHPRPHAWRYRDYVVASFNADKPFDQFIREQLAGDELEPYRDEHLIATGFLAAARLSSNEEDKPRQRNDVLVDLVNAVGGTWLGLTFNCAQCHSHKFDPITARDYYRLQAVFAQGQPADLALRDPGLRAEYEAARPPEYVAARQLRDLLFERGRQRRTAEARRQLSPEELQAFDTPRNLRTPEQELLARQADLKFQFTPAGIERDIPDEDRKLYDELKKRVAELDKRLPDMPQTFGFYSPVTSPHAVEVLPATGFYPLPYEPDELARMVSYLLVRGEVHHLGPVVEPGWPAVFDAAFQPSPELRERLKATPRLALAEWLTDPRHPLTARVWANRLWQWHFGRGLVATPSDFGVKGSPPTHPELLDWLAGELLGQRSDVRGQRSDVRGQRSEVRDQRSDVRDQKGESRRQETEEGTLPTTHRSPLTTHPPSQTTDHGPQTTDHRWSTKHIHRLIVTSSTYRQAAVGDARNAEIDPDNRLWWRWEPRRLEAEGVRDAMLAVSGELDRRTGGRSVPQDQEAASLRRSLYLFQKRDEPPALQSLFDGPSGIAESCPQRHVSTTALQSLYLLNSDFTVQRATALAGRLQRDSSADRHRQMIDAFRLVLGRLPDEEERAAAREFFARYESQDDAALVHFCQALLNVNEFVYVE